MHQLEKQFKMSKQQSKNVNHLDHQMMAIDLLQNMLKLDCLI
jgi:hypothetical protein